jgi:exodeoxyribonuclease-1
MSDSFVFYDLETTGISSSKDRILQFAAQRTDMNLNLVGEPIDIKIELAEDILPSPEACLVNRIDPTKMEGAINEAEFAKIFNEEIATKGTIFAGFNNLRFDDNFIRFLNYRNFYDPYRWHWENGRSRWDIIDLVRMTRALRPEGMNWPVGDDGKQTIKLEKHTK